MTSGLTKTFASKRAVDHLDLQVRRGEIYGLLGQNGAGKTTTVRLLNGLLPPDAGELRILGLDPTTDPDAVRRRTGVLTETPSVEDRLTAREHLELYAELYTIPVRDVQTRIRVMLDTFDLSEHRDQRVGTFSKGMKQRLAIARAMLHDPEVLFLDEPTSGLDPISAKTVNDTILRLARDEGRTVVLCTHDLTDAHVLCDRIGILKQGRAVASGTQAELVTQLGLTPRLTLEVTTEQAERAAQLLRTRFGAPVTVRDAHVDVQSVVRADIPGVLITLLSEGVEVFTVTPHPPTLQDVYFRLHETSGSEGVA